MIFTGPVNATAPDLLLALATPAGSGAAPAQGIAWNRQAQLFPLPSAGWMSSRLGNQDQGSLGFYGAPWVWPLNLGSGNATKAPQQETN